MTTNNSTTHLLQNFPRIRTSEKWLSQTLSFFAPEPTIETEFCLPANAFIQPLPGSISPPEFIEASFTNDLNIIKIHEAIRLRFSGLLGVAAQMENHLTEIETSLYSQTQFYSLAEKEVWLKTISERRGEVAELCSGKKWTEYAIRAEPLLREYLPLASEEIRGNISVGGGSVSDPPELINTRLSVIFHYLDLAKTVINISANRIISSKARCLSCNTKILPEHFVHSLGKHVCGCGREMIGAIKSVSFQDNERIDAGVKNAYKDFGNFVKRMIQFEGQQKVPYLQTLVDQLINYFDSVRLEGELTLEEINKLPHDEYGSKPGTNIGQIITAMNKTNNSHFYKDAELVAHVIWGWKLADLSENNLRKELLNDYNITQAIYKKIKERNSTLQVSFRLWFHLKLRGYKCNIRNFKIVSSKKSIKYHKKMFRLICEEIGADFEPIRKDISDLKKSEYELGLEKEALGEGEE